MNQRLVAVALTAVSSLAFAQESTLSPVVVTASRTAQTVDEALAAVTVITREDIQRRPSQSVVELLRGTPGLTVTNQGGAGKVSAVFLRGTESDHVLVLLDGVKVGGATAAGIPWHDLPLEQIERIEIVRGPRSSLYGSEAIGGVIQIFTRKGGGKLRPSASLGYGSDNTFKASAGLSGGGERSWFNLNVAHTRTDGFNACYGSASAGCWAASPDPDRDGYRNSSAHLRLGTRFGASGEVDLSLLHAEGENEFDGALGLFASPDANDFTEQVLSARVAFSPLPHWRATLVAGGERDDRDYFIADAFSHRLETTRRSLSWQNDLSLGKAHLLTLGADYQDDRVDATTDYAVDSRHNTGVFAQYQGEFGRHSLQLAARLDDNEQFGDHTTGNLAWGYRVSERLRGFVSYGTGFKAPTFDDLYDPWLGNPDLDPEESRSLELGLQGRAGPASWSASLFRTDIDELIVYDVDTFSIVNIEKARILGLELAGDARLGDWTLAASVTVIDPENRSGDANDGNDLARRPRRTARLELDRAFGRYSVGASLFAASHSYDNAANSRRLAGYGVLDLRAGMALGQDWRLQAELTNVFDKDYETSAFYRQPGRAAFVTLRYAPR